MRAPLDFWLTGSKIVRYAGFLLVLQPHAITRQLVFPSHHSAPQALFWVGHETQYKFLRHQPFDKAFGVNEVLLAPTWPAIGLCLRE